MKQSDRFGGFILMAIVFLGVAGGIALYSPASSSSPLDAASASKQEHSVISASPLPVVLPPLKPAAPLKPASDKDDPMAWDNPVPLEEAAPNPIMEMPKMIPSAPKTEAAAAVLPEKGQLEKRVTALEEAIAVLRAKNADLETLAVVVGELQQKIAYKKAVAEEAPAPPKAKSAVRRKKTRPPAAQWVLKAAKPGMAWVARKGSNEIRAVSVGDHLADIGKVTAVIKSSSTM